MGKSEDKKAAYEKKLMEVMKADAKKKMRCEYLADKLGISKSYVLDILGEMDKKGLIHLERAKWSPEKRSWASVI